MSILGFSILKTILTGPQRYRSQLLHWRSILWCWPRRSICRQIRPKMDHRCWQHSLPPRWSASDWSSKFGVSLGWPLACRSWGWLSGYDYSCLPIGDCTSFNKRHNYCSTAVYVGNWSFCCWLGVIWYLYWSPYHCAVESSSRNSDGSSCWTRYVSLLFFVSSY